MSHTIALEEVVEQLASLVSALDAGDEITLTVQNLPVARIISAPTSILPQRGFGSCKGMLIENSPVDDETHLADFKDYM